MSRKYFDLYDDVYIPGRWELGDLYNENGTKLESFMFSKGIPVNLDGPLRISMRHPGTPLDFSHLVGAPVPVVSRRVADTLLSLATNDVQMIPTHIEAQTAAYYLINVKRTVRCIDDTSSIEVKHWLPEDGRPEKLGEYRAVYGMRIDPEQVAPDVMMLRPQGWTVALVVSEEVRSAVESIGATGAKFRPV